MLYLCLRSTLPLSLLCLCLDSNPATSPYTLMQRDYPSDNNGHHIFHHTNLQQHNQHPNTKPKQKNKKGLTHTSTATRFSYSVEDLAPSHPHVIASFVTYSTNGRQQFRQTEQIAAPSGLHTIYESWEDAIDDSLPFLNEGLEPSVEDEPTNESSAKLRARRFLLSVSVKNLQEYEY